MATRLLASIIVLLTFAGCVPNTMHHSNIGKCDSEFDPKNREKVKPECMTSSTQVVTNGKIGINEKEQNNERNLLR